jgi:hypothetical protein
VTAETTLQKARPREIRRRYRRREPVNLTAILASQLRRLFFYRYGATLPDDDSGRDDAWLMLNHLARLPDPERHMANWLEVNAPWMASTEATALIARVLVKPLRFRADTLAARLNLIEADRRRLRITMIGAVDLSKAERLARRRQRARQRDAQRRRAKGAKSRDKYEAESISRMKPWEALGMSRRTWYRLGKPGPFE